MNMAGTETAGDIKPIGNVKQYFADICNGLFFVCVRGNGQLNFTEARCVYSKIRKKDSQVSKKNKKNIFQCNLSPFCIVLETERTKWLKKN